MICILIAAVFKTYFEKWRSSILHYIIRTRKSIIYAADHIKFFTRLSRVFPRNFPTRHISIRRIQNSILSSGKIQVFNKCVCGEAASSPFSRVFPRRKNRRVRLPFFHLFFGIYFHIYFCFCLCQYLHTNRGVIRTLVPLCAFFFRIKKSVFVYTEKFAINSCSC